MAVFVVDNDNISLSKKKERLYIFYICHWLRNPRVGTDWYAWYETLW